MTIHHYVSLLLYKMLSKKPRSKIKVKLRVRGVLKKDSLGVNCPILELSLCSCTPSAGRWNYHVHSWLLTLSYLTSNTLADYAVSQP